MKIFGTFRKVGVAYVVKAGQQHIVIDIVRTKEEEMYVAMTADNSLSIQHENTNTKTNTNTNKYK